MKVTKTYSIEDSLYKAFDSLTNAKNINKSSYFEDVIKKFLKDNDLEFIDKLYVLKSDPTKMVTVISADPTYYILDDGSKIQKILFMQMFEEQEDIDPDKFFDTSNMIGIFKKVIDKIDTTKLNETDDKKKVDTMESFKEFAKKNNIRFVPMDSEESPKEICLSSHAELVYPDTYKELRDRISKINTLNSPAIKTITFSDYEKERDVKIAEIKKKYSSLFENISDSGEGNWEDKVSLDDGASSEPVD